MERSRPAAERAKAQPALAIFGPTSSGKTDLSLRVAEVARERGYTPVVLNADSRQIYTGMDIGTSKIRRSEMRGIEHRLIDIADPVKKFSLERYLEVARRELDELRSSGRSLPILVGGTGTYVEGIVRGWDASGSESNRRMFEAEFPKSEREEAYKLLRRLDPKAAQRVHANNYDAIINSLARAISGGEPATPSAWNYTVLGIDRGSAEIERRVVDVLHMQLEEGLLEEIDRLDSLLDLRRQLRVAARPKSIVLDTHGYREFLAEAAAADVAVPDLSEVSLDRAISAASEHIRSYSRRQRSMFKKLSPVSVRSSYAASKILDRLAIR